jgi:hypothetical protein
MLHFVGPRGFEAKWEMMGGLSRNFSCLVTWHKG